VVEWGQLLQPAWDHGRPANGAACCGGASIEGAEGSSNELASWQMRPSSVLRIRLLGELDLRLDASPLPPLESARAESLLAYLLLQRAAPQPRKRLAFLLWPDSTEPQAHTNLRHVLHNLRRALPELDRFLEVTPRTLHWRPDGPFWLDVAAFQGALSRADGEADGGVAALREAVELYRGDLLEGSQDEWLLPEREDFRRRFVQAMERLVALLGAAWRPCRGDRPCRAAPATRSAPRADLPGPDGPARRARRPSPSVARVPRVRGGAGA
jgi:Bacterial transcriptional activator domain